MNNNLRTIHSFPRAVIHIDGDAFFASCEQSRNPKLQGKPVVTGKERGIAASMSYEAKDRGVKRGMSLHEIKKVCPEAILLPSDYETYSLLSSRLYAIVRRFTPDVEEYGIDECFADLTGLRRPLRMSYRKIAQKIKETLDTELGFTFSVGLAPNKVIAKVASKWKKPSGFTVIPGRQIHLYLDGLPVEKIWGIGSQTAAYLDKTGITTALQFAKQEEEWIKLHLTKPFFEIWQELNGKFILKLETRAKQSYQSIQKMKTFTPASKDQSFVFAHLSKNVENACIKARRYNLAPKSVVIFLRTNDFSDHGIEMNLPYATNIPSQILESAKPAFDKLFNKKLLYRSTGIILLKLSECKIKQLDLFNASARLERMEKIFKAVDAVNSKYGKHSVFVGSSFLAHQFSQHLGDRGDIPHRKEDLLKGETFRKRLGIPRFMGDVF